MIQQFHSWVYTQKKQKLIWDTCTLRHRSNPSTHQQTTDLRRCGIYMCVCVWQSETVSRLVVFDSLWPHRLYVAHQAPLSWDSPGKNSGMGCHFLLRGIFPTQRLNPRLLHLPILASRVRSQRRQWHPTPVLLPGKSHGRRSLVGCSPWDRWVGNDWATSLSLFTFMHWRRKWQPSPVFLPGESQGRESLVGCRLWGRTESDTTEVT